MQIKIVIVPEPSLLMKHAGRPWTELIRDAQAKVDGLLYQDEPRNGRAAPNTAWLREINGRAFLLSQSW